MFSCKFCCVKMLSMVYCCVSLPLMFSLLVQVTGSDSCDTDAGPGDIVTSKHPDYATSPHFFQVMCTYDKTVYQFIRWRHPSGATYQDEDDNWDFDISVYQGKTTFKVNRPASTDGGCYQCTFKKISNQQPYSKFVDAEFVPQPSYHVEDNLKYRRFVNESAVLRCSFSGATDSQWQKNGIPVSVPSDDGRIRVEGTDLHISEVTLQDNGSYRCVTLNKAKQSAYLYAHLVVYELPTVTIEPNSITVNETDSAVFECRGRGKPRPALSWTRENSNKKLIIADGYLTKTMDDDGDYGVISTLTFHNVAREDTGSYRCSASNVNGSSHTAVNLLLYGTPDSLSEVELSVNGTAIRVSWEPPSLTGNLNILSYTVYWHTEDNSNGNISYSEYATGPEETTHLITGLQPVTEYRVSIVATNSRGTGPHSPEQVATTEASVAASPQEVSFSDVRSDSVFLSWKPSPHNGGSPVISYRIAFRSTDMSWDQAGYVDTNSNLTYHLLETLVEETQYQVRVSAQNKVGFSDPKESTLFKTSSIVYPGPPTSVTITNIMDTSVVVCWANSDVGMPFTGYLIQVESPAQDQKPFLEKEFAAEEVEVFENGSACVKFENLEPEEQYHFTVTCMNKYGLGSPSPKSTTYKTSPQESLGMSDNPFGVGMISLIAFCSLMGLILLAVLAVFVSLMYRKNRKIKKYDLEKRTDHCSNPVMTATSSNGHIANSNGHIANSNGHIGNSNGHIANSNGHIAVHQTAIPMYSRQCSSGYASSTLNSQGSLNEMTTPNSATLFIPASQATNPWLFPGVYAPNTTMEYPQPPPSGGVAASVASLGPIAVLQNPFYNSQENEDDTCMMDNPVYMDKMSAVSVGREEATLAPVTTAVDGTANEIPPPLPPREFADDEMSDCRPPLPPPFLGESCSNAEFHIGEAEDVIEEGDGEDGETEFTDNDAYELHTPGAFVPRELPRFTITSQNKGDFETVEIR